MSRTLSAAPRPGAAEGLLFGAGTGKRGLSGNMRLHRRNVPWGTQVSAGDGMEERAMRTLLPHGKERGNPTKVEEPLRGNAGVRYPSSPWPQRGSRTGPDAYLPTHAGAAQAWATSTSSAQRLPNPRAACPTAQRIFLLLIGSFYLNVFSFFFFYKRTITPLSKAENECK